MANKSLKKLVIYYSCSGSTRFIAEAIAEAIAADVLELKLRKEIKCWANFHNAPFSEWVRCIIPHMILVCRLGIQVLMKHKPELLPFDKRPEEYDVLFIGTPIWSGRYTPPLRTFLSMVELKKKTIAFFCCCCKGKGKSFGDMREALVGNDFVGETEFLEPLRHDRDTSAVIARRWAKEIISSLV